LGLVLWVVLALPALAAPTPTAQIPAGSTAAIGPATQNPGPATPQSVQGKILSNALSKDTRQTLQDAMNSANPSLTASR